jgi:hypothetical protein
MMACGRLLSQVSREATAMPLVPLPAMTMGIGPVASVRAFAVGEAPNNSVDGAGRIWLGRGCSWWRKGELRYARSLHAVHSEVQQPCSRWRDGKGSSMGPGGLIVNFLTSPAQDGVRPTDRSRTRRGEAELLLLRLTRVFGLRRRRRLRAGCVAGAIDPLDRELPQ